MQENLEIMEKTQSAANVGTEDQTAQNTNAPETMEYDRHKTSVMPVLALGGAKRYRTTIEIASVSDKEFFEMVRKNPNILDNMRTAETIEPFMQLAREKAVSCFGYKIKNESDWKTSVPDGDFAQAGTQYFDVIAAPKLEEAGEDELFDIDAPMRITVFFTDNSGETVEKYIDFKPPQKAHLDECENARKNAPNRNLLASSLKKPAVERICDVGQMLLADSNYKTEIPAWHMYFATVAVTLTAGAKLGKL